MSLDSVIMLSPSHETPLLNRSVESNGSTNTGKNLSLEAHQRRKILTSFLKKILNSFADQSGSLSSISYGVGFLISLGSALGIVMPKDQDLPTPWYRVFSSILGYNYMLAWSIYSYPQIIMNYQRKSTSGLSNDFSTINVLGYLCYTVYCISFFTSKKIQNMYRQRNDGMNNTVQSNDVAFSAHALVFSSIWIFQIVYYGRFNLSSPKFTLSLPFFCLMLVMLISLVVYAIGIILSNDEYGMSGAWNWLDFLYLLSLYKVIITFVKYFPQLLLNARRKSTVGWSVWNVILDFIGGVLSLCQLLGDSFDMTGGLSGAIGNPAKLGLGLISISFNVSVKKTILMKAIAVFILKFPSNVTQLLQGHVSLATLCHLSKHQLQRSFRGWRNSVGFFYLYQLPITLSQNTIIVVIVALPPLTTI